MISQTIELDKLWTNFVIIPVILMGSHYDWITPSLKSWFYIVDVRTVLIVKLSLVENSSANVSLHISQENTLACLNSFSGTPLEPSEQLATALTCSSFLIRKWFSKQALWISCSTSFKRTLLLKKKSLVYQRWECHRRSNVNVTPLARFLWLLVIIIWFGLKHCNKLETTYLEQVSPQKKFVFVLYESYS